jgi:protein-L-isoaspartate O-methyltransferase
VSAHGRTARDRRRRLLGQNFLDDGAADRLIEGADFRPGELVIEIGAGFGAMTAALARRGVRLVANQIRFGVGIFESASAVSREYGSSKVIS